MCVCNTCMCMCNPCVYVHMYHTVKGFHAKFSDALAPATVKCWNVTVLDVWCDCVYHLILCVMYGVIVYYLNMSLMMFIAELMTDQQSTPPPGRHCCAQVLGGGRSAHCD